MFLEVPLLHFETIGISPESLVGLETTVHFPGNDDLFALLVVRDGNRIELNFEFYDFSEGLRESHLHDCLLVATCNGRSSVWVIVSDGPLVDEASFLEEHVMLNLTILMG